MNTTAEEIISFWFADARGDPEKAMHRKAFWFEANAATDKEIARRFSASVQGAARGELAAWEQDPQSSVALVVLLDQFPRNLFRGTAEAFQYDSRALAVASRAVAADHPKRLSVPEQGMLLMPYEHSEDASVQRAGVALLRKLLDRADQSWKPFVRGSLDFAVQHLEIVERFGKFPHRNAVLGRSSTPAEQAYLDGGGESFGQ